MKHKKLITIGVSIVVLIGIAIVSYQVILNSILNDIAQSHISGNSPDKSDFDHKLKRDLESYFSATMSNSVSIEFEYLREGATQSGVSYPKYYLWVTIFDDDKKKDDGAIRVAAIEKTRFEVTDFLSRGKINENNIYSVFPAPVCERIKEILEN